MGDAKRRGTREERVAEARIRIAIETEEAEARARQQAIAAAKARAETDAKRAALGLAPLRRASTSFTAAAVVMAATGAAPQTTNRHAQQLNAKLAKTRNPPPRNGYGTKNR